MGNLFLKEIKCFYAQCDWSMLHFSSDHWRRVPVWTLLSAFVGHSFHFIVLYSPGSRACLTLSGIIVFLFFLAQLLLVNKKPPLWPNLSQNVNIITWYPSKINNWLYDYISKGTWSINLFRPGPNVASYVTWTGAIDLKCDVLTAPKLVEVT